MEFHPHQRLHSSFLYARWPRFILSSRQRRTLHQVLPPGIPRRSSEFTPNYPVLSITDGMHDLSAEAHCPRTLLHRKLNHIGKKNPQMRNRIQRTSTAKIGLIPYL
jgi:hypothetical protein